MLPIHSAQVVPSIRKSGFPKPVKGDGNCVIGKRAMVDWLVSRREERSCLRLRKERKRNSPEGISFTLATSNRTVPANPLKNGFTTCCQRGHLKIPLDIERISEKEGSFSSLPNPARSSIPCRYKSPDIEWKIGENSCRDPCSQRSRFPLRFGFLRSERIYTDFCYVRFASHGFTGLLIRLIGFLLIILNSILIYFFNNIFYICKQCNKA